MTSASGLYSSLTVHGVEHFDPKKDILDSARIRIMLTPSSANPNYACGWASSNKFVNWFHEGSLPGTASELAHTKMGFSWAILANTRAGRRFSDDLD
jgi:hypothetical protein